MFDFVLKELEVYGVVWTKTEKEEREEKIIK